MVSWTCAVRLHRLQHVDHGRQLVVFRASPARRCPRPRRGCRRCTSPRSRRHGEASRWRAAVAPGRPRSPAGRHRADIADAGQVLGGKHRKTGDAPGCGYRKTAHAHWTSDERHLAHSRKTKVRDVLPAAVQEAIVLLAAKPYAPPRSCSKFRPPSAAVLQMRRTMLLRASTSAPKKKIRSLRLASIMTNLHAGSPGKSSSTQVHFACFRSHVPQLPCRGARGISRRQAAPIRSSSVGL